MSEYIAAGADDAPVPITLEILGARTAEILQRQKDEEDRRKWTLLFTIGGALFAAVRLGIIAIPHLRKRHRSRRRSR